MRTARRPSVVSLLLALAWASPVAAAGPEPVVQIRFRNANSGETVRQAVLGAAARLASDSCRAVLGDFSDGEGESLEARLERDGGSLADWLAGVYFYDGASLRPCALRARVLAFTAPGHRVVYLCPALVDVQRREPRTAELVVIHELLHTLGLPENPPTSLEINRRVADRCGS